MQLVSLALCASGALAHTFIDPSASAHDHAPSAVSTAHTQDRQALIAPDAHTINIACDVSPDNVCHMKERMAASLDALDEIKRQVTVNAIAKLTCVSESRERRKTLHCHGKVAHYHGEVAEGDEDRNAKAALAPVTIDQVVAEASKLSHATEIQFKKETAPAHKPTITAARYTHCALCRNASRSRHDPVFCSKLLRSQSTGAAAPTDALAADHLVNPDADAVNIACDVTAENVCRADGRLARTLAKLDDATRSVTNKAIGKLTCVSDARQARHDAHCDELREHSKFVYVHDLALCMYCEASQ